jgi:hypothetical protein
MAAAIGAGAISMAEPEFHGVEESDVITRGRGGVYGVPLRTPRASETKRLEKCFMTGR